MLSFCFSVTALCLSLYPTWHIKVSFVRKSNLSLSEISEYLLFLFIYLYLFIYIILWDSKIHFRVWPQRHFKILRCTATLAEKIFLFFFFQNVIKCYLALFHFLNLFLKVVLSYFKFYFSMFHFVLETVFNALIII